MQGIRLLILVKGDVIRFRSLRRIFNPAHSYRGSPLRRIYNPVHLNRGSVIRFSTIQIIQFIILKSMIVFRRDLFYYCENQSTMSGLHYRIQVDKTYFLTPTVVDWVDLFTRPVYKQFLIEQLKFCQEKKGLNIFAWCLMTNHLHLIVNTSAPFVLNDVMRDFKKFTSKALVDLMDSENESRRNWILQRFLFAGTISRKHKYAKFWQEGNNAIEIYSEEVLWQKINYIHRNPVKEGYVFREQDYMYSSARNYYGLPNVLPVTCVNAPVKTVTSKDFFKI